MITAVICVISLFALVEIESSSKGQVCKTALSQLEAQMIIFQSDDIYVVNSQNNLLWLELLRHYKLEINMLCTKENTMSQDREIAVINQKYSSIVSFDPDTGRDTGYLGKDVLHDQSTNPNWWFDISNPEAIQIYNLDLLYPREYFEMDHVNL